MVEKHQISSVKTYLSSKEGQWFWISLAFIFAFFIFSWITSDNVLILFVKRVTNLIFSFLLPGYVITKIIYPNKNELNLIERFAFSVAFSLTFIMIIGYILNYVWEISRFSLAITTFLFAVIFSFAALLRTLHISPQELQLNDQVKLKDKISKIIPLLLLCALFLIIQSHRPITNLNLFRWDSYAWSWMIAEHLGNQHVWTLTGYPIGFRIIIVFLSIFLDIRPYDAVRFIPIFHFLNIVPVYLLANHIFKSKRISLLSGALYFSTRWGFNRNSYGHPETLAPFLLMLSFLVLLKTMERPSTKNSLVTSLLLSSTVLMYHLPIQFLIFFLPSVFLLGLIRAKFSKKSRINTNEMAKTIFLIGIPLVLLSGFLWYFWQIVEYLQYTNGSNTFYLYQRNVIADYPISSAIKITISKIGFFETIFSFAGLIFIARNQTLRGRFRYQFLIVYFITLFLLSNIEYFGVKNFNTPYIFAYLILPASLLSSYGFFNVFKSKFFTQKGGFALIMVLLLLVNFNGFNYVWINEEFGRGENYKNLLIKKLNQGEYTSLFFYHFRYNPMGTDAFTREEFNAYKWLQKNTPLNSAIIGWGSYNWNPISAIGERDTVQLHTKKMRDIPTSTLEEISRKIRFTKRFRGKDTYILAGLKPRAERFESIGPPFSLEVTASISENPNFKRVYQNSQVKIYKIEAENYTVVLDKLNGFVENFTDTLFWGLDLNENRVLSTNDGFAAYLASNDNQPIDVDFSTGLDTRPYPYFETRMKVDSGKISIGVYDSTGKVHMFLRNYTTNGEWKTYKFNLYDWLTSNGYETEIYGLKITNTLGSDSSFSSSLDWIDIHNHIFWDMFEEESKVSDTDKVSITDGYVVLSKKIEETLSNGGFENDFEGWHPRGKWSIDVEEFHSGNKSAILRGTVDPAKDASAYLDTQMYRGVLKPNTPYRFSAWVRGNVTSAVRGSIKLFGSTVSWPRPPIVYFSKNNKAYDNWTYNEEIIMTPENSSGDFHIRIYGGGGPAVWIDDVSFGEDVYESSGMFISTTTNTKNTIISVTPTWSSVEPNSNVNITLEISVDSGTSWTGAENGVAINYAADDANKYLLYRAFFETNDTLRSPILNNITITYEEKSP